MKEEPEMQHCEGGVIGEGSAIKLSLVISIAAGVLGFTWWASGVQSDLSAIKNRLDRLATIENLGARLDAIERYGSRPMEELKASVQKLKEDFELHKATTSSGNQK